jgi:excisionase family DNA binding protein
MKRFSPMTLAETEYPLDHLATTEDVAKLARVSKRTVQAWFYSGVIPGLKIGRLVRFRLPEVRRALSRYTREEVK